MSYHTDCLIIEKSGKLLYDTLRTFFIFRGSVSIYHIHIAGKKIVQASVSNKVFIAMHQVLNPNLNP